MIRTFGGLGGAPGGRPRDENDAFESAVDRAMGERLRADGRPQRIAWYASTSLGARLWGSLANVDWVHENGDEASYSFRAAGDLIAAIVGVGDYMDWYCSHRDGRCDDEVRELMAVEGWCPAKEHGR